MLPFLQEVANSNALALVRHSSQDFFGNTREDQAKRRREKGKKKKRRRRRKKTLNELHAMQI